MVSSWNGRRRSWTQSARAWDKCKNGMNHFNYLFFCSVIPEGCSKVWMGPTRQTLALLYWAPSGTSTILSICLQEQPVHPFGTVHKSVREGLEWSRLPMSVSLNGSKQHKWWGAGGGAQITFPEQENRSTGAANKTFSDSHSLPPSIFTPIHPFWM